MYPDKTIGRPYPKAWIIGKQLTADGKRFSTRTPKADSPRTTYGRLQGRTGPLDDDSKAG